jgi:hypothetical protein
MDIENNRSAQLPRIKGLNDVNIVDNFGQDIDVAGDMAGAPMLQDVFVTAEHGIPGGQKSRHATVEDYKSDDEDDRQSVLSIDTYGSFISD